MMEFKASAWKDCKSNAVGSTYGFRIRKEGQKFFKKNQKVLLYWKGEQMSAYPTESFDYCPELRHEKIKKWLDDEGQTIWKKGYPPVVRMQKVGKNTFKVRWD